MSSEKPGFWPKTFEQITQVIVGGISMVIALIMTIGVLWMIIYVVWSAIQSWLGVFF